MLSPCIKEMFSKIFKRNRKPLVNIRKIFRKAKNLLDLIKPKKRKIIVIDETKLSGFYVWAARDIERGEIIAFHVSKGRSFLEAYLFVRKVLRKCLDKPELILVDKGPWYKWVLERFGLNYKHERFGKRNSIESWFFILKHRTKRFYNSFKRNAKDIGKCVESFVYSFVSVYNLLLLLNRGELS